MVPLVVGTPVVLLVEGISVVLLALESSVVHHRVGHPVVLVGLLVEESPVVPLVAGILAVLLEVLLVSPKWGKTWWAPWWWDPQQSSQWSSLQGIDLGSPALGALQHRLAAGNHVSPSEVGEQVGFPVGPTMKGTRKVHKGVLYPVGTLHAVSLGGTKNVARCYM